MKRIISACLDQTIHFQLKEEMEHDAAVQASRFEVEGYKKKLERSQTKYKIIEEIPQADGSIIIKIKKQCNGHACGEYLA